MKDQMQRLPNAAMLSVVRVVFVFPAKRGAACDASDGQAANLAVLVA